uniref:Regulator of G protein signaling 1 n=1 Tax=Amphilophus citrinellus TaxID=61819 RepID=A0A3Q0RR11_AMPCI
MPKLLFSRIRFYEFKDLMPNIKRPRRTDIVLNPRRKTDIQCISVHKCNDEMYPSNLRYYKFGTVKYLAAFRSFLKSEFSEENIEFWLACENFRLTTSPEELRWRAEEIYKEFIQPTACKEINVDHHVREKIKKALEKPSLSCFDEAQKHVYLLMERDSCPRFLHSDAYLSLKRKSRTLWYL